MKFELQKSIPKCDVLFVLLHEGETPKGDGEAVKRIKAKDFHGKLCETLVIYKDEKKVVLLGLGKKNTEILAYEKAGGKAATIAKGLKAKEAAAQVDGKDLAEFLNGFVLGSYEFNQFKKVDKEAIKLEKLTIVSENNKSTNEACEFAEKFEAAQKLTRDLINTPAGNRNTLDVTKMTQSLAKKHGLKCTVYDEKHLEKMGCGALLGVGRGGEYPPRLITLEYNHKSKAKNPSMAFVGKGITFDTGGLNLKPTGHIETMKLDLAGAAAVLSTMILIAEMKLPGNFVGVMAMAENSISDRSMHPGDILKAYNGKTIEVLNTDAEGRLVLADALSFAEDKFKPEKMMDVATLTGAVTVALGYHISGLMGNNEKLLDEVMSAAKEARERMWVLPMDRDFVEATKGEISDTKNASDGIRAGTIMGAAFLQQFVEKTPWVHIDIGGTGWVERPTATIKFGGTAAMIRTMWQVARRNSK